MEQYISIKIPNELFCLEKLVKEKLLVLYGIVGKQADVSYDDKRFTPHMDTRNTTGDPSSFYLWGWGGGCGLGLVYRFLVSLLTR